MTLRSDATFDLLLASAPVLRFWTGPRSQTFRTAWLNALKGDPPRRPMVTAVATRALLQSALRLCEAAGIDGPDLVAWFNDRCDAGDRAELDDLLDHMAMALLDLTAAKRMTPAETAERENA